MGDILSNVGDVDAARTAYLMPKPGSDDFVTARGKLAWTYQADGDKAEALKIAREAHAAEPDSTEATTTLADLLRADEQFEELAGSRQAHRQPGRPSRLAAPLYARCGFSGKRSLARSRT